MSTLTSPEREHLRAVVYIRGAIPQLFYGRNRESLLRRALRALNLWEPGFASTRSDRVELQRRIGVVSGNRSLWEVLLTLRHADVLPDKQHWRTREAGSTGR
jgi:hypothetical protein